MPRPPIAFVCKFVGDIRRIRSAGRATRIATLGFLAERSARIFADPIAPNDLPCLVLVPAVLAGLSNFTGFWGWERTGEAMGCGLCNRYSITTNQEAVRSPGKSRQRTCSVGSFVFKGTRHRWSVGKSWSLNDRCSIERAKASKSLEGVAQIMKCRPERICKVAMRLGISFETGKRQ